MSGTDELNRSVYETRTETDYTLDEEEQTDGTDRIKSGVLSEALISENLSNFGPTADSTKYAFLNLSLPGNNLHDIKALATHRELHHLDLSYNKLKDLSVLSELPFLLELNVSNNQIENLFDFLPPYNLKEANFSFNNITQIGNLANFHYLQTLELNNNKIQKIEGLEFCQRLKNLNLAHNVIRKIEGLDNLPLVNLDLRSNQIKKIDGLHSLKFLRFLNLSSNQIRSLNGLPEKHEFLERIDLENNKIVNLGEIEHLVSLNLLRELNLHNNPAKEVEDYRLAVLYKLPKLIMLDRRKVDALEKVNAVNLFQPSPEYIASRDHMTNFIFNMIQDHKVKESTLPNIDSPYPILILCGPDGSGVGDVARRLAKEYSEYFDYVPNYTTRPQRPNEVDRISFNFIRMQEFEQDVTQGKFICCNEYNGDWYGIQWESIEAVARQGLACVTQMELEALLSFKQYYFEPRCVLITTLDREAQLQRLLTQGCNQRECDLALARTEWYSDYNQNHPGFFDSVIVTDDLNEGYYNLRELVLNYLGVSGNKNDRTARQYSSVNQNMPIQRQFSNIQSSRGRTEDDFGRDLELQRADSFLPSNTETGNKSQLSHISIESLSQLYNQNLRLKFGSAPAQLLTVGPEAEMSLEKRASAIKRQFQINNDVSTKSQVSQNLSKQAIQGTLSSASWIKRDEGMDSRIQNNKQTVETKNQRKVVYNDSSDDSDDDNLIVTNRNNMNTYSGRSNMTSPRSVQLK